MMLGMSAMTIEMPQRRRTPRDTFALRLVELRHDLGMTQKEVAELTHVSRAAWNTWENGRIPQRQADIAKQIADATGYDLRWLLYGLDNPSPDDHTTGRFPVRVRAQEQQRIRTIPQRSFRLIQTAA